MTKIDEMRIARFVDGELSGSDRAAFERRIASDAVLAAAVRDAEERSRLLRESDDTPLRAPDGFSAAVLTDVCRMPSRDELIKETDAEAMELAVVSYGRRLLVAAVLVFGIALLFGSGLLRGTDNADLSASDDQLMQELDRQVKEMRANELLRDRDK